MDTNAQRFNALPKRTRNAARTRMGLLDALLDALKSSSFEAITTQSLCDAVGITQPTFFKYYPLKSDVLVAFVHLWSVELQHEIATLQTGRAQLETIFERTGERILEHPRVMHEIIAHQMRMEAPPTLTPPTQAELLLRFPERSGVEQLTPLGVDRMIAQALERAHAQDELEARSDELPVLIALLVAAFFGIPAAERRLSAIPALYHQALERIVPWRIPS